MGNAGRPQFRKGGGAVAFLEGDNDLDHARPRDQVEKAPTEAFAVAHVVVRLPVTTFWESVSARDTHYDCREGDSSSARLEAFGLLWCSPSGECLQAIA